MPEAGAVDTWPHPKPPVKSPGAKAPVAKTVAQPAAKPKPAKKPPSTRPAVKRTHPAPKPVPKLAAALKPAGKRATSVKPVSRKPITKAAARADSVKPAARERRDRGPVIGARAVPDPRIDPTYYDAARTFQPAPVNLSVTVNLGRKVLAATVMALAIAVPAYLIAKKLAAWRGSDSDSDEEGEVVAGEDSSLASRIWHAVR